MGWSGGDEDVQKKSKGEKKSSPSLIAPSPCLVPNVLCVALAVLNCACMLKSVDVCIAPSCGVAKISNPKLPI